MNLMGWTSRLAVDPNFCVVIGPFKHRRRFCPSSRQEHRTAYDTFRCSRASGFAAKYDRVHISVTAKACCSQQDGTGSWSMYPDHGRWCKKNPKHHSIVFAVPERMNLCLPGRNLAGWVMCVCGERKSGKENIIRLSSWHRTQRPPICAQTVSLAHRNQEIRTAKPKM